ncbi:S-methyl-5'-thioadenosine phosphorylase [Parapedomonas caeni]
MSDTGTPVRLGIIGGSGLYQLPGLEQARWESVETPWGAPSDAILTGRLAGLPVAFLPRHGRGHVIAPSDLNHRANIDAMKRLGVTDILSLSACGSFREELAPGTFVVVDQFIDRTQGRPRSFFGDGVVAHVSMAAPTCGRLGGWVAEEIAALGVPLAAGGTYLCIEGPQFSTRAESRLYRSWGADVIGMTNLPEAYLAREAEICYQTIAMVTDYDSWHDGHDAVEVADILRVLADNAEAARALVARLAARLAATRPACARGCDRALDGAVLTDPACWPERMSTRLAAVAGRLRGDPA